MLAKAMKALRVYALSYPLILPLALFATWLAGRVSLGHWPRPSLDDPSSISLLVDFFSIVTGLLLVIGLPAFIVAVLGITYAGIRDPARRRSHFILAIVSIVCIIVSISVIRMDPFFIVSWFMD